MKGSLRLLTVRGIPIRLHWSFLIILFLLGSQGAMHGGIKSGLLSVLLLCLIFTLVVLHELAHSIVAQKFGLTVREIVLLPIGGMAMMDRIPEEPGREAAIAIAGPMLNFAIMVLLYYFMKFLPGITFDPSSIENNDTAFTLGMVALYKFNFALFAFNLIPAFPMDGGRLLRAGLVKSGMGYVRATSMAANVSRGLLALMLGVGLYKMNPFLVIIPLVLFSVVSAEENAVRGRASIKTLRVRHLFPQEMASVSVREKLGDMVSLLLSSPQRHFPVMKGNRVVGIISASDIRRELAKPDGPEAGVASAMRPTVVISPDEPLASAQKTLESRNTPAAVVAKNGKLLGVVSLDMLTHLSAILDPGGE